MDDKQRDRKHPFSSFYSAGRAKHGGRWGERPTVQARYVGELVHVAVCGNRSMRMQDRYVDVEGGGVVAGKGVRCMQWWCCVFVFRNWQSLANRSMRIQDLYVGAVPIPQFIKKNSRG